MNMFEIVRKAANYCKRNITATQKGGVLTRMVKETGFMCTFEIDPSVGTACWSFNRATLKHNIKCGTSLGDIANASTNASERKMKKFVETVIRHESEHGICTDRTCAAPNACQDSGIPFTLYNLFEDCRIEYLSATRKGGDGAFRWVNFQDVKDAYNVASSLLWAIKTKEAGIKKSPSASVPSWTGSAEVEYCGKPKKTRLVVLEFYKRIIRCESSMALMPILIEWVKIFGKELPPEFNEKVINGVIDPNPDPDHDGDKANPADAKEIAARSSEYNGWLHRKRPFNDVQISRIARAMSNVIQKAKMVKNKLSSNGNKLYARQAMTGSERSFLSRGRTNGKRSITLIVDTSGSMNATWSVHGGREFVLAFRQLARESKIDLNLILTQVTKVDRKAVSTMLTNQNDLWINNLRTNGDGEGVMQCMKRWLPVIKKSTTSVIFTDAQLTDNDIDTQAYRNMGLNTIAAYIEPNAYHTKYGRAAMNRHFARSVIAENATDLARRLMAEVLKD